MDKFDLIIISAILIIISCLTFYFEMKNRRRQQQKEFLRSILDNMNDGLIVLDSHGLLRTFNRQFTKQFGELEPVEKSTSDIENVIALILSGIKNSADKNGSMAEKVVMALRRQMDVVEFETDNGHIFNLRSTNMPGGGAVFVFRDVTERRRYEQAIQHSESAKNAVIVSALDCIIAADTNGCITEFNPAAEATFGWSANEVIGRKLEDTIIPPDLREGHRKGMEYYLKTGVGPVLNKRIEVSAQRKNGEIFACELAITPTNVSGAVSFTAYLRDIESRKQRELELKEAQAAAELANNAKSEFLAHISHEIRTPMNAITGYSALILDTHLDSEQKQFAEGISEAAVGLLELINDVLDLSQLEAGKLEIVNEPFQVSNLLKSITTVSRVLVKDKAIDFHVNMKVPEDACYIGDASRLRQILLNLTGNAIKFTERGEIELSVSVITSEAGKDSLEFTIRDTGVGISTEDQKRIFGAFEQAKDYARKIGGTGLGLTISRTLARKMQGDIFVASIVGEGSVFRLVVPLKQDEARQIPAAIFSPQSELGQSNRKILVAEDTPASQIVIRKLLEKRGHLVVMAGDGLEALELAEHEIPDLIFLDIQMPGMDGLSVAKHLRSLHKKFDSVPIIALTAQAFASDRQAMLDAGMNDILPKPIKPADLDGVLTKWINADLNDDRQPQSADLIDSAMMDMLTVELGQEAAHEFLSKTIENSRMLLNKARQCYDVGNQKELHRCIHSLSGLLAQIGFVQVADTLNQMDQQHKLVNNPNIDAINESFEESVGEIEVFLQQNAA